MTKYHMSDNVPMVCTAKTLESCRKGGDHFDSPEVALKSLEKKNDLFNTLTSSRGKNIGLPKTELVGHLHNFGGYFGMHVETDKVSVIRDSWRDEIGAEKADVLEGFKDIRDGGAGKYHVTVLTPKEKRILHKQGIDVPDKSFNYRVYGVGSVSSGEKEAWYALVESDEIDEFRASFGLPKHNLHITLGFLNGDVHDKPKDSSTLRYK